MSSPVLPSHMSRESRVSKVVRGVVRPIITHLPTAFKYANYADKLGVLPSQLKAPVQIGKAVSDIVRHPITHYALKMAKLM